MMKYKCNSCERGFDIPAWISHRPIINVPSWPYANPIPFSAGGYHTAPQKQVVSNYEYTVPCCTFCYSQSIEENKDE